MIMGTPAATPRGSCTGDQLASAPPSHVRTTQKRTYAHRIELRLHDETTLLPLDLTEELLASTRPVHACGIDLSKFDNTRSRYACYAVCELTSE